VPPDAEGSPSEIVKSKRVDPLVLPAVMVKPLLPFQAAVAMAELAEVTTRWAASEKPAPRRIAVVGTTVWLPLWVPEVVMAAPPSVAASRKVLASAPTT